MKYAAQCGNAATVKHFAKELPTLGESTVRLFKKHYQVDLKKVESEEEITQLTKKRRGRPLTLGNLDKKVQQYIKAFRKAGTPVNARVILAATEGIVKATDHFAFREWWSYQTLPQLRLLTPHKDGLCEEKGSH